MKPTYCVECAQPLVAESTTVYNCPQGHQFFNNPSATAAVVFIKDGLALFSRRAFAPSVGKYDFPGGFLEYNESPYDGAVREIAEETGVVLKVADLILIDVYSGEYEPGISVTDIVFLCRDWTGEFIAQDDSAALEWKPLSFVDGPQSNVQYPGLIPKIQAALEAPLA